MKAVSDGVKRLDPTAKICNSKRWHILLSSPSAPKYGNMDGISMLSLSSLSQDVRVLLSLPCVSQESPLVESGGIAVPCVKEFTYGSGSLCLTTASLPWKKTGLPNSNAIRLQKQDPWSVQDVDYVRCPRCLPVTMIASPVDPPLDLNFKPRCRRYTFTTHNVAVIV